MNAWNAKSRITPSLKHFNFVTQFFWPFEWRRIGKLNQNFRFKVAKWVPALEVKGKAQKAFYCQSHQMREEKDALGQSNSLAAF